MYTVIALGISAMAGIIVQLGIDLIANIVSFLLLGESCRTKTTYGATFAGVLVASSVARTLELGPIDGFLLAIACSVASGGGALLYITLRDSLLN